MKKNTANISLMEGVALGRFLL